MNYQIRNIAIACIIVTGLNSCLKKAETVSLDSIPPCAIIKQVAQQPDGKVDYTRIFERDNQSILLSMKHYAGNLYSTNPELGVVTNFAYDESGNMIRIRKENTDLSEISYSGDLPKTYEYTHTENGNSSKQTYSLNYTGNHLTSVNLVQNDTNLGKIFNLAWSGENIDRIERLENGNLVEWYEFDTYDDTTNIGVHFIFELFSGPMDISEFHYLSKNNALYRRNGFVEPNSGWYMIREYHYDEFGKMNMIHEENHWNEEQIFLFEWKCPS